MKTAKKALSLIMSLLILSVPFSVSAASENALRNSVVSVASAEIGYTGTSTYSKYGEWYGYQGSWCTTFIFWCFNKAGSDNGVKLYGSIIPSGGNCNSMISWFSNKGRYHERSDSYSPKKGDLVFFDWTDNGSADHVGIVTGISGSTVYTVEGNCSGKVKSRTYTSTGSKPYNNISSILGYGVPAYSSSASSGGQDKQTTKKNAATEKSEGKNESSNSVTNKTAQSNTTKKNNATTETSTEETTQSVELESLEIRASTYDLQIGDTVKLHYTVEPSGAPAVVGYFCDEEGIIEIGADGNIKAVGTGTATVVVCANNELYKQCDFFVKEAVAEVTTQQSSQEHNSTNSPEQVTTARENFNNVLMGIGINVDALSQNKQLYVIPAAIIAVTFFISVFVAVAKKIKQK